MLEMCIGMHMRPPGAIWLSWNSSAWKRRTSYPGARVAFLLHVARLSGQRFTTSFGAMVTAHVFFGARVCILLVTDCISFKALCVH